ncbi:MAG TPA: hypothetical protein PK657_01420 [Legionella sp.]|nr:hypothetical protein [Legionella sp.]
MLPLRMLLTLTSLLYITNSHAICINNETSYPLHYEIYNKKTDRPAPKVQFYSGIVNVNEKKCHAHTPDDPDWSIYRQDLIKIVKMYGNGTNEPVCNRKVEGILNTLTVMNPYDNQWLCLDNQDSQD